MQRAWRRIDRALERGENAVLVVIMVALFSLVTLQVLARLTEQPPTWTEEVSRYLMVWLTFLGAAVCIRYNEHVGFLLLSEALAPWVGDILRRATQGITLALMLVLLVQGGMWVGSLVRSGQTTITFDFPIYWVGLALPVAGFVGAVHSLRYILGPGREPEPPHVEVE
jgi:TRAP-type C4-dicarboxylate transport system permease small subunit